MPFGDGGGGLAPLPGAADGPAFAAVLAAVFAPALPPAGSVFDRPGDVRIVASAICGGAIGAIDGIAAAPRAPPSGKLNICCAQDDFDPAGTVPSGIGMRDGTSPSPGEHAIAGK